VNLGENVSVRHSLPLGINRDMPRAAYRGFVHWRLSNAGRRALARVVSSESGPASETRDKNGPEHPQQVAGAEHDLFDDPVCLQESETPHQKESTWASPGSESPSARSFQVARTAASPTPLRMDMYLRLAA